MGESFDGVVGVKLKRARCLEYTDALSKRLCCFLINFFFSFFFFFAAEQRRVGRAMARTWVDSSSSARSSGSFPD